MKSRGTVTDERTQQQQTQHHKNNGVMVGCQPRSVVSGWAAASDVYKGPHWDWSGPHWVGDPKTTSKTQATTRKTTSETPP